MRNKPTFGGLVKVLVSNTMMAASRSLMKAAARAEGSSTEALLPFINAMDGSVIRGATGDRLVVSPQALFRLRNADPISWAIHNRIKARLTRMEWGVEPDVDDVKALLDCWEAMWTAWASPNAVEPDAPKWRPDGLPDDVGLFCRTKLPRIKAGRSAAPQVRWVFDQAMEMAKAPKLGESLALQSFLAHCNQDTPLPFDTLLERTIDDCLVIDFGFWGLVNSVLNDPMEIYSVPGDEMVRYLRPNGATPQPPDRAYGWKVGGRTRQDYTTQDGLPFILNPGKDGLGMSPIEASFHIITGTLFADAYNMDMFSSNIPPGVLNLGDISDTERRRFRNEWENEVMGRNRLHRLLFVNSPSDKINLTTLKDLNAKDMQYLEYVNWAALIKCAVHGVSPQDVGITLNVHKETSQTQAAISGEGIDDMATKIEGIVSEGYFGNVLGRPGMKFRFKRKNQAGLDEKQSDADGKDVERGILTRDEARRRRGLKALPIGGDVPTVNAGKSGIVLLESVVNPDKPAADAGLNPDGTPADGSGQDGNPPADGQVAKALWGEPDGLNGYVGRARDKRNRPIRKAENAIMEGARALADAAAKKLEASAKGSHANR